MVDLIDYADRVIEIAKKRARFSDSSCSSDSQYLNFNWQTQRLGLERSILTGVDYSVTFVETHKDIERRIKEEILKKVVVLDDGDVCSICLQDIDTAGGSDDDDGAARVLNCSHTFHSGCISRWKKRKTNCPLCRHDMHKEQERRRTVTRRKVEENPIMIIE